MSETSVVSVVNSAGHMQLKRNFKKRHVHLFNEYFLCVCHILSIVLDGEGTEGIHHWGG